jgi:microcystin-dependent protein
VSDPFLAEIRIFAGNFAPTGWAFCDGQLLAISQNTALFSLLGTTYGGDGRTTFALPNLAGSAPLQPGQGPGLSPRALGETGGSASVTLINSEMPAHTHAAKATGAVGDQISPAGMVPAIPGISRGATAYTTAAGNTNLSPFALDTVGTDQPHNNMPPYLTLTFIIALQGIYPARN